MDVLDLDALAKYIDVEEIPEDWINCYSDAKNNFEVNWLNIDFQEIFDFYNLDDNFRKRFLEEITILKEDINLNFLVYLWYFIIFFKNDYKISRWTFSENYFKSHGSCMMMSVALLMGYNIHIKVMEELNFDKEQIFWHKENIRLTCLSDNKRLGLDGIRFSQMIWGSRFMKGHIIQVGALQYELKKNYLDGEDVIFIHIPRNTKLDMESVDKSLSRALLEVKKYLTHDDLKYVTESWLLSRELRDILDSNSNIIKFQDKFLVVKEVLNVKDFLNFVFDETNSIKDYKMLKEDTRLQKGLKGKLLRGEKLHIGIGILK